MAEASLPPIGEFELSDENFDTIRKLVRKRAGIDLGPAKRMLVYGRLARRLRELKLKTFSDYLQSVEDPQSQESERFLNALTTNVTEFFRESHHFDWLTRTVLPEIRRKNSESRRFRIWSAGCSTGEEPYSIAMTLSELGDWSGWDARILATDIDSDVLKRAERGVYPEARAEKISPERLARFFTRGRDAGSPAVRVKDELSNWVRFRRLNLLETWPMTGKFDAIFCRNVVIYFDGPTRERLVERFAGMLADGGYLFLGHSESLVGSSSPLFSACGKTIYRKRGGASSA